MPKITETHCRWVRIVWAIIGLGLCAAVALTFIIRSQVRPDATIPASLLFVGTVQTKDMRTYRVTFHLDLVTHAELPNGEPTAPVTFSAFLGLVLDPASAADQQTDQLIFHDYYFVPELTNLKIFAIPQPLKLIRYAGYKYPHDPGTFRFVYCHQEEFLPASNNASFLAPPDVFGNVRQWGKLVLASLFETVIGFSGTITMTDSEGWIFDQPRPDPFLGQHVLPLHVCSRQSTNLGGLPLRPDVHYAARLARNIEARKHLALHARNVRSFLSAASDSLQIVTNCASRDIGNGICNDECNLAQHQWDGGDCCFHDAADIVRRRLSKERVNCLSGPQVLFLHGASVHVRNSADLSRQFSDRTTDDLEKKVGAWGALPALLRPYSVHQIFNAHNTYDYGWNDTNLQRAFYDKAKAVYDQGGVVFAHSLANLILAGACADQGLCDAKWYAVGPPFRGARVTELPYPIHGATVDMNNTGIGSMRPSYSNLYGGYLSQAVKQHGLVLGILCGISPYGSGGMAGVELTHLVRYSIVPPGQDDLFALSDGIVTLAECSLHTNTYIEQQLPANTWSTTYKIDWSQTDPLGDFQLGNTSHPFAILEANHPDLAGGSLSAVTSTATSTLERVAQWYASRILS